MLIRRTIAHGPVMVAGVALLAIIATPAHAATLCVNPGGTGGCFASLDAAVDATGNGDVIDVQAGTYSSPSFVGVPRSRRLTIRGAGPASTVLLQSLIIDSRARVTISGVRFQGVSDGITVQPEGRLDLTDSAITGSNGRGLSASTRSTVRVTRCTISANQGSGVRSIGRLELIDSTVSNNGGDGLNLSRAAAITGSTISGNAGGIYSDHDTGSIRVTDSTISGNGALVGGGIYLRRPGRAILDHVTITANSATTRGGGIADSGLPGRFTLRSSIIAGNTAPTAADCSASGMRLTVPSLIEDRTGCGISSGPVIAASPLLEPLQDNGGPTATHALLAGSPALGALTVRSACRGVDQRGVARAVPCDLGAFEAP